MALTRSRRFLELTLTALRKGDAVAPKPAEVFPTKSGERWVQPLLSARSVASIRKEVLLAGFQWPYDEPKAPLRVHDVDRKVRAHRLARVAKLEAGLKTAQERLTEYYKSRAARYKFGGQMSKFFQSLERPKAVASKHKKK